VETFLQFCHGCRKIFRGKGFSIFCKLLLLPEVKTGKTCRKNEFWSHAQKPWWKSIKMQGQE
jgi:hypothetical protein